MPEEKGEDKGFVVKDRRIFSEESGSDAKEEVNKAESSAAEKPDKQPESAEKPAEEIPLPEINFSTFVFSLHSSAVVQLGLIDDPASGRKTKNLPMAKQTIDILGMLEEKTKGNLTKEEENFLKHILYDLRLLYIKENG